MGEDPAFTRRKLRAAPSLDVCVSQDVRDRRGSGKQIRRDGKDVAQMGLDNACGNAINQKTSGK